MSEAVVSLIKQSGCKFHLARSLGAPDRRGTQEFLGDGLSLAQVRGKFLGEWGL